MNRSTEGSTTRSFTLALGFALLALPRPAGAGQVELVSQADPGFYSDSAAGASGAGLGSLSDDGRYLVFISDAPNLVAGQADPSRLGTADVFLHDRVSGTITLVSHASGAGTTAADDESIVATISADGRFVAFDSRATNLVPGQQDQPSLGFNSQDVFLYDRTTGEAFLVSGAGASPTQTANGFSSLLGVSADGRFVLFTSTADDLVPGQVESSTGNLFLHDHVAGTTVLVDGAAGSATTPANGNISSAVLSADGRFVLFTSDATDLVAGATDANGGLDVFLFDRVAGTTVLLSHASGSPTATANAGSFAARISADGNWIAFASLATDLLAGTTDTNGGPDVFLLDRAGGTLSLRSAASGSPLTTANGGTGLLGLSADGSWLVLGSAATDLVAGQVDTNGLSDIFLQERASGATALVTHVPASPLTASSVPSPPPFFGPFAATAISADGRYLAFQSGADDLVSGQVDPGFSYDVFLFDRNSGGNTLVSHRAGSPAAATAGDGFCLEALALDAAGDRVAFSCSTAQLVSGVRDANGVLDVFLNDRASGDNALVSARDPGLPSRTPGGDSTLPYRTSISADGRAIAFLSTASDLMPGLTDVNGASADVFVRDLASGSTVLASGAGGSATTTGNGSAGDARISEDGRVVLFASTATDLVPGQADGNGTYDVFLRDLAAGTTTLVSHAAGAPASAGNGLSQAPAMSASGGRVVFLSTATDLLAAPVPCCRTNVYLYDRATGATTLVSRAHGSPGTPANASSTAAWISGDGRWVLFESFASDLVPGQTAGGRNVYLFDSAAGTTVLVSAAAGSATVPGNADSFGGAISADGRYAAFTSGASDLLAGEADPNPFSDVFVFDRATGAKLLASRAASGPADGVSYDPTISADGRFVSFLSGASNLVAGQNDANQIGFTNDDVFLFDRATGALALVSHASGSLTATGNAFSGAPTVSRDGRVVVFQSYASDLVPGQQDTFMEVDVFLYDRLTGEIELASRSAASPVATGNGQDSGPVVSADGFRVAFNSESSDLVEADWNRRPDVFLYTRGFPPGLDFFTVTPCRRFDTRQPGQGPALTAGVRRAVAIAGGCGVPPTARAVAVNLTVTQPTGAGHLTIFPGDFIAPPVTSAINFSAGQTRANQAILTLAAGGAGTVLVDPVIVGGGSVHLIVDVVGYFE